MSRPTTVHVLRHFGLALAHLAVAAAVLPLSGCSGGAASPTAASPAAAASTNPQQAARLQFYRREVLPTLQANCLRCHGGMNRRGGFNMSTRANLLQGGKDGPAVIIGRPEDSLLLHVLDPKLAADDPMRMPPKGDRLSAAQVAAIRKWVADGLVMDR
ncbi:c-type cytochrome domain-containing protein [Terriglobus aquaticus]|uniref:C-type cytochrome domain-containing protein n=1 Tax=Terriglobus aquaticus TaxID=940139 RepID=A0ABW9KPN4_9BACT